MKLEIKKLIHGGSGVGEVSSKKIFVPFSAPGDELEVEIVRDYGQYAEAKIIRITQPAAGRVEPECPVFGQCGGCQWQHLSYEMQLKWKQKILAETLQRIGKINQPKVFPAIPSPKAWHYRNRIQLHIRAGKVGFYREGSHEIVEFEKCLLAEEELNTELQKRREEFCRRDKGIALSIERGEGFAQINSLQNENLKKVLVEWLQEVPHSTVVELYAGAGNLTWAIASVADWVLASDHDGRAVKAAQEYIRSEGIDNVRVFCAPAERGIPKVKKCDVVILDPPRKGCAEAVGIIAGLEPKSILYVSCDPATLSKDARDLVRHGYYLEQTCPLDMFPQTYHIESLSRFLRGAL